MYSILHIPTGQIVLKIKLSSKQTPNFIFKKDFYKVTFCNLSRFNRVEEAKAAIFDIPKYRFYYFDDNLNTWIDCPYKFIISEFDIIET